MATKETHPKGPPDRNKRYFRQLSWTASAKSPFLTFRRPQIHLYHCEAQIVAILFLLFPNYMPGILLILVCSARQPNRCHHGRTQSLARPLAPLHPLTLTRILTSAMEADWTVACMMPLLYRKRCKNTVRNHHMCPRNRPRRMVRSTLMLTVVLEDPAQVQVLPAASMRFLHCGQQLHHHMEMRSKCGLLD